MFRNQGNLALNVALAGLITLGSACFATPASSTSAAAQAVYRDAITMTATPQSSDVATICKGYGCNGLAATSSISNG
jgi:hypothetical protein